MKAKRLLSLLMALCMIISIIPAIAMNAHAASVERTIVAGSAVLTQETNTAYAIKLYYGSGSKWVVVGNGEKGIGSPSGTVAAVSADGFGTAVFNNGSDTTNDYAGSNLQTVINNLEASNFSAAESAAIAPRDLLVDESWSESNKGANTGLSGTQVNGAHLWPLSGYEASKVGTDYKQISVTYWTRSPGDKDRIVLLYSKAGGWSVQSVNKEFGIRPAFYLNLDSILFTSKATGGKVGAVGTINAVDVYEKTKNWEWKTTVLDKDRNFAVTNTTVENGVVTVTYTGAKTGNNEYISVLLAKSDGSYTHYGRAAKVTAANGTATIDLSNIEMDGKTVYVFNEQYNGGDDDNSQLTDYGSKPVALELSFAPTMSDAAKAAQAKIDALPEESKVQLTDKDAIDAAKAAYEALSADDKALVSKDKLDKAAAALKKLEDAAVPETSENAGNNDANNGGADDKTDSDKDNNNNNNSNNNNSNNNNNNNNSNNNNNNTSNNKPSGNKDTGNGSAMTVLWIVLVVVLCGAIATAVIFILKMKKAQPQGEAAAEEVAEEAPAAEDANNNEEVDF